MTLIVWCHQHGSPTFVYVPLVKRCIPLFFNDQGVWFWKWSLCGHKAAEDNKQSNTRHGCSHVSSYKPWRLARTQIITCSWNRTEIDIATKPCVWEVLCQNVHAKGKETDPFAWDGGWWGEICRDRKLCGEFFKYSHGCVFIIISSRVNYPSVWPPQIHSAPSTHHNPLTQSAVGWRWRLQTTKKKGTR